MVESTGLIFRFKVAKMSILQIEFFQVAEQRETEPSFMRDCSTFELTNSKFAMVTICNVLMNVTVLEPDFVGETQLFFQLLKFIMNSLPTLENSGIPNKNRNL